MATEIIAYDEAKPIAHNVLAMIATAAANPDVDVAKMTALLDLQERVIARDAEAQFNAAFAGALSEMPTISKKGAIRNKAGEVQSRYAKWEDLYRIVMPILRRHGLALSFEIGTADQQTTVEALLTHTAGHMRRSGAMRLPIDTSGSKNAVQGVGSVVQYGKRYTACAILNILTEGEDIDGQMRSEQISEYEKLVGDATAKADEGIAAYEKFFKALSNDQRRQLDETGKHQELKARANKACPI